jgi:metal-responsive CopG/Arc/MetJ family transcriptional regulator
MTKLVSVRIEEELLAAVDEITQGQGRARADAFREALEEWVRDRRAAAMVRRHREGYARKPVRKNEFSPVLGAQVWPK